MSAKSCNTFTERHPFHALTCTGWLRNKRALEKSNFSASRGVVDIKISGFM